MTQSTLTAGKPALTDLPPIDWQAVLARHQRWLRTVVLARLGEPQAVEDVMQEVSLAAVRQQAPLADPSKVAPWLYRLAVTQALLYRRKQGRRRRATDQYAQRATAGAKLRGEPDPLSWLLADERRKLVRAALRRLPKRDAEILLLKYSEDWSYRELADHLGVTQAAVQARLHRARQRLRTELAALQLLEAET
ncbi:MAG: RNA polymerase sigma factor [Thermoguttaceae bacterium]